MGFPHIFGHASIIFYEGKICPVSKNSPCRMTGKGLGRRWWEQRLAERLGGGDGAAEAKQERYAALRLPSPPP
eukprot:COSAG02_NODE_46217_length_350_cov_3.693227_2_plen_72_part_01